MLIDGRFSDELFSAARLGDARIHALTDKIAVKEEPEFTRVFPERVHCRIEIETTAGERRIAAVEYPRGHFNNPMTDAEVETKFRALAARMLPEHRAATLLEAIWNLERAADLDPIFNAMNIAAGT